MEAADRRVELSRDGGACGAIVLGLPLCLAAAGAFTWGFPETSPSWSRAIGLGFLLAGLAVSFGRSRLVIDPEAGLVSDRTTLLVPLRVREWPLSAFRAVRVADLPGRQDRVYHVQLEGPETLSLLWDGDYARARGRAEDIASRCRLPLEDEGRAVLVGPPATPAEEVAAPAEARCAAWPQGDATAFDLPAPGYRLRFWLALALGLLLPAFLIGLGLAGYRNAPHQNVRDGLLGFCLLAAFVVLPFAIVPPLSAATRSERVTASPRELRLEWVTRLRRGADCWPAAEVADLYVRPSSRDAIRFGRPPGLVLCARRGEETMEFGAGLSRPELLWLRLRIREAMTAPVAAAPAVDAAVSPAPRSDWVPTMPPLPPRDHQG